MRPIELKLKNIGPFLDETINFDELENMFIITGNTGAGKTFIFDAMTYALYGVLKGNRENHEKDLKSRYAAEDETDFYVEFTFCVADKTYKVRRTVEYTKKGKKTPTAADVSVMRLNEEGRFESLCDGKIVDKNNVIKNIIGLTAAEFSQVILLPQGAFADFLKQSSKERSETLKKLFPVNDYTRLMDKAKEKKEEFDSKIKAITAVINGENESIRAAGQIVTNAEADAKIEEMDAEINQLQAKENDFTSRQEHIASEETALNHDLVDAKTNAENTAQLNVLKGKAEEYKDLEKKLNLAEKANSLGKYIIAEKQAAESVENYTKKLAAARTEQNTVEEKLKVLEAKSDEMKSLNEANIALKTKVDSLSEKIQKIETYNQLKNDEEKALKIKENAATEKENYSAQIAEITKSLNGAQIENLIKEQQDIKVKLAESKGHLENQEKDAGERDKLEKKLSAVTENITAFQAAQTESKNKVEKTQNTLNLKKQEAENFKITNTAFSLVNVLKPGIPCPVCGSTEHPCPAKLPEGLLNPEEEVKIFEKALETVKEELSEIEKKLEVEINTRETINAELPKYKDLPETDAIKEELKRTVARYNETDAILSDLQNKQQSLTKLNALLISANENFAKKDNLYTAAKTARENLENELGNNPEALQTEYNDLLEKYQVNCKTYQTWDSELNKSKSDKAGADSSVMELSKTLESMEKDLEKAESDLNEQIENSDFESSEAAENAMLGLDELREKREHCENYNKKVHSLTEALKNARKVEALDVLQSKIDALLQEKSAIKTQYKSNHDLLERKKAEKITFKNSYDKIKEKTQEKEALEKEALPYKKLYENLAGTNAAKVPFDVWALGMYFEQVVEYASERFFEISDHRFEFMLKDLSNKKGGGYKGLDLQVLDHNTPNIDASDTADLSGGETFEASISLALAITDVVQNNNGGIVLDSLFIDEGFGTLDADLLDKTMGVLKELSETKMIGLISHVDTLQDSDSGITSQINVKKTNTGSSIEKK